VAEEVAAAGDESAPVIDSPLERYRTLGSAHPDEVRRVAGELLESLGFGSEGS
jgi:hypothetical protein